MLFQLLKKEYVKAAFLVFLALAGGFFIFYFRTGQEGVGTSNVREGELRRDPVFALVISDMDGMPIRLEDYRGRPLVVALWASWSPYSATELMNLSDVSGEYGDRITAVAINRGESPEAARADIEGVPAGGDILFLFDRDDAFFSAIQGFSTPETVFIDKEGMIRFHKRGAMAKEELRRRVQDLFGL